MAKKATKNTKTSSLKSKSNGKQNHASKPTSSKAVKKTTSKAKSVKQSKSISQVAPAPVFLNFGHISINVESIAEAKQHYFELFGAKPFQEFPHYNSKECGLGQGFLDGKLDMDVCHLMIPNINIMIELFHYNVPKMEAVNFVKKPYQTGLVSHIWGNLNLWIFI